MVQISSKFLRITDKAYFLCVGSYSVHSYENNTDTVTTLQINLSVVCSTVIDNLHMQAPMDNKPGTLRIINNIKYMTLDNILKVQFGRYT